MIFIGYLCCIYVADVQNSAIFFSISVVYLFAFTICKKIRLLAENIVGLQIVS